MKTGMELYFSKLWLIAALILLAVTSIKKGTIQPIIKIIPIFQYHEPVEPTEIHKFNEYFKDRSHYKQQIYDRIQVIQKKLDDDDEYLTITDEDRNRVLELIKKEESSDR